MALDALLARLEGRAVTPVTANAIPDVTPEPAPMLACTPVTSVTAENDDTAGKATSELLPDQAAEARRQRVLAMLAERPGIRYAVMINARDADPVIVALAIRDVGTCELAIPAANYDAFALLALMERHRATVH
jgi:hypothetical protein